MPNPTDLYIDCVVLSSFHSEFTFLRDVFKLAGMHMHHADSLEEADFLLTVTGSTVLLVDVSFAGGSWQTAVSQLTPNHPLAAILVLADPVDRPFLRSLFTSGACGVLWKPFEFQAVRKLIRAAHGASCERRVLHDEILIAQP